MSPSLDPVWEDRSETLDFQLGPLHLGSVTLRTLSLVSNPFAVPAKLEIPLAKALVIGCRGVVRSAVPIDREVMALSIEHGALRYSARYGDRYVVDLQGSFAEYLKKFSKKSRGNLQRTVKKFATKNTGLIVVREFKTLTEIREFRDIAVAISRESYKKELGWGFQEDEQFARQLELDATGGRVRGYVLMCDDAAVAYVFCRIDHDVILYKHIGYHPRFAQRSPGTALLYLLLKRLFAEGEFRLLDFDGTEYYAYKEFFATRAISCARVFWVRPRLPELALFTAHWMLTTTWRLFSVMRHSLGRGQRRWVTCRIQQKHRYLR
ncbi:MAG: GNAT family N-acetyltransferase [Alphaproteobacteria bacterium]|nr:GNAT family N-acetyltransferase [Alphaproteobacteria bacterium]